MKVVYDKLLVYIRISGTESNDGARMWLQMILLFCSNFIIWKSRLRKAWKRWRRSQPLNSLRCGNELKKFTFFHARLQPCSTFRLAIKNPARNWSNHVTAVVGEGSACFLQLADGRSEFLRVSYQSCRLWVIFFRRGRARWPSRRTLYLWILNQSFATSHE